MDKKTLFVGAIAVICALSITLYISEKNHKKTIHSDKKSIEIVEKSSTERINMQKTASGIEYTILQQAVQDTRSPQPGDVVSVHYTGWLNEQGMPGKQFDSSVTRGEPLRFKAGTGRVIQGWDETILSMKEGEKRRVIIPAYLAYGPQGFGNIIPPNASLIFDMELIKIG